MTQKIYKVQEDIELENSLIQQLLVFQISIQVYIFFINVLFASINVFAYACKNSRDERTVAAVYGIM